jgi:hypothetical protein
MEWDQKPLVGLLDKPVAVYSPPKCVRRGKSCVLEQLRHTLPNLDPTSRKVWFLESSKEVTKEEK